MSGVAIKWKWQPWMGLVLLVVVGFFVRAAYYRENYGHPDEPITTEVVRYMRQTGDWDTNWAKTKLEPGLRYDQYNFSSYLYGTFFFYRAVKWVPGLGAWRSHEDSIWVYRFFSVLLATLVVGQTWSITRRVGGELAAGFAGLLVVAAPLLVHDAHYMRPEAFVTALTLAAVSLSLPGGRRPGIRSFGAAVLIGLLVACKVSMLALAWLPLIPGLASYWAARETQRVRWLLVSAALTVVGIGVGFSLGAPGALLHPTVFKNGVQFLMKQYAGLHPPYSHVDGGAVGDLMAGYFRATLGWPALVAGVVGIGLLVRRRRAWELVVIAGPVMLFVGYFATRWVFFERNLSHVVPLFCVLAGIGAAAVAMWVRRWGGRRWGVDDGAGSRVGAARLQERSGVAGITVVVAVLLLARPAEVTRRLLWTEFSGRGAVKHAAFEAPIRAAHRGLGWWSEALLNDEPLSRLEKYFQGCGGPVVFQVVDYNDEWSARHAPRLLQKFQTELIAEYPSEFADVPGCTLHTYNSASERYYLVRGPRTP